MSQGNWAPRTTASHGCLVRPAVTLDFPAIAGTRVLLFFRLRNSSRKRVPRLSWIVGTSCKAGTEKGKGCRIARKALGNLYEQGFTPLQRTNATERDVL